MSSYMGCPCFYPDPVPESGDPEFQSDQCACGHALDEHDDTGECQAQGGGDSRG